MHSYSYNTSCLVIIPLANELYSRCRPVFSIALFPAGMILMQLTLISGATWLSTTIVTLLRSVNGIVWQLTEPAPKAG